MLAPNLIWSSTWLTVPLIKLILLNTLQWLGFMGQFTNKLSGIRQGIGLLGISLNKRWEQRGHFIRTSKLKIDVCEPSLRTILGLFPCLPSFVQILKTKHLITKSFKYVWFYSTVYLPFQVSFSFCVFKLLAFINKVVGFLAHHCLLSIRIPLMLKIIQIVGLNLDIKLIMSPLLTKMSQMQEWKKGVKCEDRALRTQHYQWFRHTDAVFLSSYIRLLQFIYKASLLLPRLNKSPLSDEGAGECDN